MLRVRAVAPATGGPHVVQALPAGSRRLVGPTTEHLLVERPGGAIRLDVVEGTTGAGPFSLWFDLADDDRLEDRLKAIRSLRSASPGRRHDQMARRLIALHATDARDAGATLKQIAEQLLGPGDWPGDGEHRKSMTRRLVAMGDRMLREGPRVVLTNGWQVK